MAVTELRAVHRTASELDDLIPLGMVPHDPAQWADADDEGLGGYQR